MPQEYQPAPEVEEVARRLINDFHSHLGPIRIEYVFVTEQLKEKGKVVWGRAKKVSGLNAWLADKDRDYDAKSPDDFFVVEIHRGTWLMIDEKSRRALVDHELCHFWVDENGNLSVLGHDLEEFNAVVRRHGLWADDIKFFLDAANHQKDLFERAKEEDDDGFFGGVLSRVADEINDGALGPDVTASVKRGARA